MNAPSPEEGAGGEVSISGQVLFRESEGDEVFIPGQVLFGESARSEINNSTGELCL